MKRVLSLIFSACVASCASSQVSQTTLPTYSGPTPSAIALSPGGGVVGEAIGLELFNRGYSVVDPNETSRLLGRENLGEFELSKAASLPALSQKGIDALLVVKAVSAYDGKPQSATARITATADGRIISAVSWQNGRGGQAGSPADRTMRKDAPEAAKEIVDALGKHLGTSRVTR